MVVAGNQQQTPFVLEYSNNPPTIHSISCSRLACYGISVIYTMPAIYFTIITRSMQKVSILMVAPESFQKANVAIAI